VEKRRVKGASNMEKSKETFVGGSDQIKPWGKGGEANDSLRPEEAGPNVGVDEPGKGWTSRRREMGVKVPKVGPQRPVGMQR